MALLEARDVSKILGEITVLRGVDLAIEAGTMLTITGRSGSGKSTLLKLLAGLDRPSAGQVLLEGIDLASLDDARLSAIRLHRIGLLFQSPMLLPDLTVQENVRLPIQLAGGSRASADARVRELLAVVGVAQHADKRPNTLSGGEAQRVSIARALANEPAIVFADEPTSGLDSANAQNVLQLLDRVNADLGTTILVATHDPIAISRARRRISVEDGAVRSVEAERAIGR